MRKAIMAGDESQRVGSACPPSESQGHGRELLSPALCMLASWPARWPLGLVTSSQYASADVGCHHDDGGARTVPQPDMTIHGRREVASETKGKQKLAVESSVCLVAQLLVSLTLSLSLYNQTSFSCFPCLFRGSCMCLATLRCWTICLRAVVV